MKEVRRAQFTIFAVLGLVIMIIFGLFFFSLNQAFSQNLDSRAREAVQDFLSAGPINYYVDNCLELAAKEAIIKYARQEFEGDDPVAGTTHIPFNISDEETINVSYSLQNTNLCQIVSMDPPDYPYPRTRLVQLRGIYTLSLNPPDSTCALVPYGSSGFFGRNTHIRLCTLPGPNMELIEQGLSRVCLLPGRVPNYNLLTTNTIESEFKKIINESMAKCANFEIFEEFQGHNVTIIDDPEFKILFDYEDFTVKATYPFEVKLRNRQPVITNYDFEFRTNVRFTALQRFIYDILHKESSNIFFNITKHYNESEFYLPGFNVTRIDFIEQEIPEEYRYDWILNITDQSSFIDGEVFSVFIGIKNRRPALDYIRKTSPASSFDIIIAEGDEIKIEPRGYDPDDREVTYTYSGWRETYLEIFDPEIDGCGLENLQQLSNCMIRTTFDNSEDYPRNWTNSQPFQETFRDAKIKTNESDIGVHNVTVNIRDIAGLMDFQTIRILVFDLPQVNITIDSIYPGLPPNVLSIEDPFTFSGEDSALPTLGLGNYFVSFNFSAFIEDADGEFTITQFSKLTTDLEGDPARSIEVPFDLYDEDTITIRNIHNYLLTQSVTHRLNLLIRAFIPAIDESAEAEDYQDVEVYDCIPHRSSQPSHPYNPNQLNPFLANHTCCLGDITEPSTYSLANSDYSCYEQDRYGELERLKTFANQRHIEIENIDSALQEQFFENNFFDVYKLEFERFCDGTRGNICAGDSTARITVYDSCPATSIPSPEPQNFQLVAQCTGPDPNFSPNPSANPLYCVNYSNTLTFERIFSADVESNVCGTADPFCNTQSPSQRQTCQSFVCDGQGGCTQPNECACNIQSCNAQCDSANRFNRDGNTCSFGCNLNSCMLQQQANLPCSGSHCLNDEFQGIEVNTCYFDVSCSVGGGSYNQQICQAGVRVNENGDQTPNGNFCITSFLEAESVCGSEGCGLTRQHIDEFDGECETSVICSENGWACQGETTVPDIS